MKNVSFRNKIIIKLLGAVAISFYFIWFNNPHCAIRHRSIFIKHEDFGMFEVRLAMLFLFTFAILNFIVIFCYWFEKNSIFEAHFGKCE